MALKLTVENINMWDVIKEFNSFESLSKYIEDDLIESEWDHRKRDYISRFTLEFTLRYNFVENEVTHIPSFGETFLPITFNLNRIRKKEVREAIDEILWSWSRGEDKDDSLVMIISEYINDNLLKKFKDAYIEYNRFVSEGTIPPSSNSAWSFPDLRRFSEFNFDDFDSQTVAKYILHYGNYINRHIITDKSLDVISEFIRYGDMSNIKHIKGTVTTIITNYYSDDELASELLKTFIERAYELEENRDDIVDVISDVTYDKMFELLDISSMDKWVVSDIHRRLYELTKILPSYSYIGKIEYIYHMLPKFKGDTPFLDVVKVEDYKDFYIVMMDAAKSRGESNLSDRAGVVQLVSFSELTDLEVIQIITNFEYKNDGSGDIAYRLIDEYNASSLLSRFDIDTVNRVNELISFLKSGIKEDYDKRFLEKVSQTFSELAYVLD